MTPTRQLAAIMFTDIEGYTSLMHRDEDMAIQIRNRHRKIFESITEEYRGRILQYYGDGTLSIFNSIVDAVGCGVALQQAFRQEPQIPVRIGIHSGDITLMGDEIAGDGVNVASRIEALAVPGSVLISGRVYEELKNHTEFSVTSYGVIPLKNVRTPVKIYGLMNPGLVVPDRQLVLRNADQKTGVTGKRVLWASVVLFLVTVVYGLFLQFGSQSTAVPDGTKSIAVLPFVNLSNDPSQEYFSDGMTADLLSQLSKINDLRVVSRTSVMQYKNSDKPIKKIANELDATHILEGSVRKHQNQVRIAVNLIEAKTDNRIWSVDFDREMKDILDVQREVSLEVVKLLEANLTDEERSRVEKIMTFSEEAYEYYQKGQNLIRRTSGTRQELDQTIRLFEEAIKIDPMFALAYVGLADAYLSYATWGRISPSEAIPRAYTAAMTAMEIDDELGECYEILGAISLYQRDIERAEINLHKALEMSPSYVETYNWLGKLKLIEGNLDDAIYYFEQANKLDPLSTLYNGTIVWAYYVHGQFSKAIEAAEKVLMEHPADSYTLWNLGNVYTGMGQYEKAIETFNKRSLASETNWALGYAYGKAGRHDDARKVLNYQLEKATNTFVPPAMIGVIYLGLGDHENALIWLEKGVEEGIAPILMVDLIRGPTYEDLRSNPKFQELIHPVSKSQS